MKAFFTADWLLNSQVALENRSCFSTIDSMNAAIINNTNQMVAEEDTLFILGNFVYGPLDLRAFENVVYKFRKQIFCKNIYLIIGNQDRRAKDTFTFQRQFRTREYLEKIIEGQGLILNHYPIECVEWNRPESWHLHGHTRKNLKSSVGYARLDVGIDNVWKYLELNDPIPEAFRPLSFEEVKTQISYSLNCVPEKLSKRHQPLGPTSLGN